jgi:ubiquinone/menaquinone biosynthesis C-methylase UbiE
LELETDSLVTETTTVSYHLSELAIALDPDSPRHAMPQQVAGDRAILDIGCGIGQTLVACAQAPGRRLVGLDIDHDCLTYGRQHFGHIEFVHGTAEQLPFREGAFDLVVSRVALPYSDIGRSLHEIARVLGSDGRVWLSLHSFAKTWAEFKRSLGRRDYKDVLFRAYVATNGSLLHCLGRQLRFPRNRRCESLQTSWGMRRSLEKAGFTDIHIRRGEHFICTARKRGGAQ